MSGKPIIDVQLVRGPVQDESWQPFPQPAGAECVFFGRTRAESHPEHGSLTRLHYEAYEEMALRVLSDLARDAVSRFGCLAVRIRHAIGEVPVGEASVAVNVVCGHRDNSFEACRFLIDALKASAPIWKQEVWADGKTWSPSASIPAPARPLHRPKEPSRKN